MTDVKLSTIQFRRSFTAGYRPASLAEGEMLIQFADQRFVLGGANGASRVEVPFASSGGGGGPSSTDALPEGTSNLYFTNGRARSAISVAGSLAYNAATGVISYTAPTLAAVATSGSASDLGTGTLPAARLPTSGATAGSYGSATLVPVITVDATGRITSVTTAAVSGGGGGPSNTDALPEGTSNFYFTTARARSAISASGSLAYNSSTGVVSYTAPTLAPVATSGSASDLSTGTLSAARLPARTGDVTSPAGSAVLTLSASGVTAGSYTNASFTVDAKGRVTAAANGATVPQSNFTATRAPTVTDDASAGYAEGSRWMNKPAGDMYTCRDATAGAARWVKVDVADHPGYVAGRYYLPFGHGSVVIVGANAANTIYLAYGVIKQRTTISQLGARVTTAASGNFQLAIYQHNPATAGPGALVASTPSGSTGTVTLVNVALASNLTLEPGAYWFACNQDNATAVFMALGLASPAHVSINGDAANAVPVGTSNASQVTGFFTASTFGTWPADLTSASFTNASIGRNPVVQFLVAALAT